MQLHLPPILQLQKPLKLQGDRGEKRESSPVASASPSATLAAVSGLTAPSSSAATSQQALPMTASLTSPADSSGQNTQTPQTQTLHAQTASSADAVTTSETPTEAATSLDNPLLRSQSVTVNAVSASIKLLRGQTTADQPASETLGAEYFQRLGATGSFTVNTDDLVAGNTIVITPIAQSSTEPTGALAGFCGDGSGIKLEDQQGRNVGTIYYDSNLKAIVLRVATTISDPGQTQTYSLIGPWFMVINYNTPFPVMMKMLFSNTLTICGQSYTFIF